MEKLDKKDRSILQLLYTNSKISIKEVAKKIGLSPTPVFERIKRLEKNKIIKNYRAIIDQEKLGFTIQVFCQISLAIHSKNTISQFESLVAGMDEVIECYHVAGNFDYLLKILAKDMSEYETFLKSKLTALNSISNIQSTFIMDHVKNNKLRF